MAAEILARLPAKFEAAKQTSDLFFFPSTLHKHEEGGIEFQVRLCPALLHKPVLPTPHFEKCESPSLSKPNPFLPPYIENLYVGDLQGTEDNYAILLNKFSVVPLHFLMVTKEYRSQNAPLTPGDLGQTYSLLIAGQEARIPLFAYFNCGDRSGASQHHKHLQFIPIEDEVPPIEAFAQNAKLERGDRPFLLPNVPYSHFVRRLGPFNESTSSDELEASLSRAFMSLLDMLFATIRRTESYPSGSPSYNVLISLNHIHLIPRSQELHCLSGTGEKISINSLGFAGMPLVKCREELDAMRMESVINVLQGVGVDRIPNEELISQHEQDI